MVSVEIIFKTFTEKKIQKISYFFINRTRDPLNLGAPSMGFEKKGLKFPSAGPGSQVRVNYKQFQYIPYVPPILDQLLDLISLARINI